MVRHVVGSKPVSAPIFPTCREKPRKSMLFCSSHAKKPRTVRPLGTNFPVARLGNCAQATREICRLCSDVIPHLQRNRKSWWRPQSSRRVGGLLCRASVGTPALKLESGERGEWAMTRTMVAERKRLSGPRKHNYLELAAHYCDGINRGKTPNAIAIERAGLVADRTGIKRKRQTKQDIERTAAAGIKSYQRARDELLRPWNPAVGMGIHQFETSTKVTGFGIPMFMGRPLPRPLALEPRIKPHVGRPKKSRG